MTDRDSPLLEPILKDVLERGLTLLPEVRGASIWIRDEGSYSCRAAVGTSRAEKGRVASAPEEPSEHQDHPSTLSVPLERRGELLGQVRFGGTALSTPRVSALARIVADWIAAEVETARLRERLDAQREEQATLASAFSHDLKSPLILIANYATLLRDRLTATERAELLPYLDRLRAGVRRAESLAKDLTAYLRLGQKATHKRDVPLAKVVESVCVLLAPLIDEKKAQVEFGELPRVRADRSKLEEVLLNLIENALKYSGEDAPPVVRISARTQGGFWRVEVHDRGPGIPDELVPALFNLFSRLPEGQRLEPDGSGVGLAVVRRIVEDHGGRVGVQTGPDSGATFWFTLPRA